MKTEPRLTVRCMYSCRLCGLTKIAVDVPARGPNESVVHWVGETAARMLGEDHSSKSPTCRITKLDEVWIPIDGAARIGDPPIQ